MKHHSILFLVAFAVLTVYHDSEVAAQYRRFVSQGMNYADDEKQMVRLSDLMRGYFQRLEYRLRHVKVIKVDLLKQDDQTRALEKGFLMHDIVETYRKALVFTKKQMSNKRYTEASRIRYMTYVQNAYIKIYHLVHMMHEIDPKFMTDNTGQINQNNMNFYHHWKTPAHWNTSGFYYTQELEAIRQARQQDRQKKVQKEKRLRLEELERYNSVNTGTVKTTTNWWPVAYGWDADYYW